MMGYDGPWYEMDTVAKDDAFYLIKTQITKNTNLYKYDDIKKVAPYLDNLYDDIIRKYIMIEYDKYGTMGSTRGYYSFTHKYLCNKITFELNLINLTYTIAIKKLKRHAYIFLHWWYKPGGPGYYKLCKQTKIGKPV